LDDTGVGQQGMGARDGAAPHVAHDADRADVAAGGDVSGWNCGRCRSTSRQW
jgi:hypothetical protein